MAHSGGLRIRVASDTRELSLSAVSMCNVGCSSNGQMIKISFMS